MSIHPLGPRSNAPGSEDQLPATQRRTAQDASLVAPVSPYLTYETYYGLREKPFSLSANPRFLYRSPSHAQAFDDLDAAIRRREGLIVLTGDIGTGKTTLCRAVLDQLDRKTFSTFVPDPFVTRGDLLKMILIDFGVMSIDDLRGGRMQGASRPDLSYPLYEFLDSLVPLQAFAVLVIDEAQNLSLPLLEEIRILSDLERREKLLQVVLVGQPDFRAKIRLPEMRQLDQRVSVRCELQPLGRDGVIGYVAHRIRVAGGGIDRLEFTPDALDLVFQVSNGVPRLINLVCDRALHHGWHHRTARIEPGLVRQALRDLDLAAPAVIRDAAPAAPPKGLFEMEVSAAEPDADGLAGAVDLTKLIAIEPEAPPSQTPDPADPAPESPAAGKPGPVVPDRRVSAPGPLPPRAVVWPPEEPSRNRVFGRFLAVGVAVLVVGLVAIGYLLRSGWPDIATTAPAPPPSLRQAPPIEARPAPEEPGAVSGALPAEFPFVIEVALFKGPTAAERLVAQLTDAGFVAYQAGLDLGAQGQFQQVLAGPYRILADAESDLALIRVIPGYADARIASTRTPRN